jgi:Na+/proline symporter
MRPVQSIVHDLDRKYLKPGAKSHKQVNVGRAEGRSSMIRTIGAAALLALAAAMPLQQAAAQENVLGGALLGGAAGAIIGGAATGRGSGAAAGAVIGATTGALIGSQMEPRQAGYYWYEGRCWLRYPNGEYHRVSRRHCGY